MEVRNLNLRERVEDSREVRVVLTPVHFSIDEIEKHFYESFESVKNQFDSADDLMEKGKESQCKMIWRAQIVFAEGLLDFLIHEVSKFCLFQMFSGNWEKTEKYLNISVPMRAVEEGLNQNIINDWFFCFLNEKFSNEVYLSAVSMQDQLNLVGVGFDNLTKNLFSNLKQENAIKEGKKLIKELFERRNLIVHQNDRDHKTAIQSDISKDFVSQYLNNVELIAKTIIDIVKNKDKRIDK